MFKRILLNFCLLLALLTVYIFFGDVPRYRAERLFFGGVLPVVQKIFGLKSPDRQAPLYGFVFEQPQNLRALRMNFHLDDVVKDAANDFEKWVLLMHWVRDRFPHADPGVSIPTQSFDGEMLLARQDLPGIFCGQVSQLLIQSITSLGGYARRVELRFSPQHQHAVIEVWSETHGKWVVLDPDSDIYFSAGEIPLNAVELHRLWVSGQVAAVTVHGPVSKNGIYQREFENQDFQEVRDLADQRQWNEWDGVIADKGVDYKMRMRYATKQMMEYAQISFPLRNDWKSRPLPWWHPEGNHVQNSLLLDLPTMRVDEDFLVLSRVVAPFYASPVRTP